MNEKLVRVGTVYIPVSQVEQSADWYTAHLGAVVNYMDEDKAILDLANQSFFLVRAQNGQSANFYDASNTERFLLTFEVDGLEALQELHREFTDKEIQVGEIEDRGHAGRNFVFFDLDGNKFDVWSELSPVFKERYLLSE